MPPRESCKKLIKKKTADNLPPKNLRISRRYHLAISNFQCFPKNKTSRLTIFIVPKYCPVFKNKNY